MSEKIRLFFEGKLEKQLLVKLDSKQAHYLGNVMRQKPRDLVRVYNQKDGEWRAIIREISNKYCLVLLTEKIKKKIIASTINLVFCPVKKNSLEYVIQKTTELGVSLISLVYSNRVVRKKTNIQRLKSIAVQASEQCGRIDIPLIYEYKSLEFFLNSFPRKGKLLFCNFHDDSRTKEIFTEISKKIYTDVLIGPEGGFDQAETNLLSNYQNIVSVKLNDNVLRSETAAIAAVSILQASFKR